MKCRVVMIAVLAASCASEQPSAGLHIGGGPQEVGAQLFVDSRYAGTVGKLYWVVASPYDTIFGQPTHRNQPIDSSDFTARLDVTVRGGKRRELLFLGAHEERAHAVIDLGESTDVQVSFASGTIHATDVAKPSARPGRDDESGDTGEGYHDDAIDSGASTPADTLTKPHRVT